MDREIVDTQNLTKEDCDKMLQVVDLIEDYQRKITGASHINIPLHALSAYGISVSDIKKLSKILEKSGLIVKNNMAFMEESSGDDLILRRIAPQLARQTIQHTKETIDDTGMIILQFEDGVLARNLNGKILLCDFKAEKYPIDLIDKLMKSNRPLNRSALGKDNNWSRTVIDINKRTRKNLILKIPLIINEHGGYEIDTSLYKIKHIR